MDEKRQEWLKCRQSFPYFVHNYCQLYDATSGGWIPFHLWPDQMQVAEDLVSYRLTVILKARQLGMTWLVLCYELWRALFHPIFTGLVFSRRETEAIYLMSKQRLRGIYMRLPDWMKVRKIVEDSKLQWQLSNGSVIYGFPTSAGDSYTASFAMVDEADLVPDLDYLMNAVKPTIDGGGGMCLLSRVEKDTPQSTFKRMYKAAKKGESDWHSVFLPWYSRPERDQTWYEAQKNDSLARTGGLDDLYEQYPATDTEALKAKELEKRFPARWLEQCYFPMDPIDDAGPFYYHGLRVYREPKFYESFVISADPAEGNPTSDDSAAHVFEETTGEECAVLQGKIEPKQFAEYLDELSRYYNDAPILPERNNHGHAVILQLDNLDQNVVPGPDDKPGWATSQKSKAQMYVYAANAFRDGNTIIHDETSFLQLASIGGDKLEAPEGEHDDVAVSYGLGMTAIQVVGVRAEYGDSPTANYRG